jgi:hypothetical protein
MVGYSIPVPNLVPPKDVYRPPPMLLILRGKGTYELIPRSQTQPPEPLVLTFLTTRAPPLGKVQMQAFETTLVPSLETFHMPHPEMN